MQSGHISGYPLVKYPFIALSRETVQAPSPSYHITLYISIKVWKQRALDATGCIYIFFCRNSPLEHSQYRSCLWCEDKISTMADRASCVSLYHIAMRSTIVLARPSDANRSRKKNIYTKSLQCTGSHKCRARAPPPPPTHTKIKKRGWGRCLEYNSAVHA